MSSPRLLPLCLLVLLAAACTTPTPDTLRKIRETGSVTLGYRDSSRPFSFLGDRGEPVGYTIDLCARVVAQVQAATGRQDLKVKWVRVTPEDRIAAVAEGRVDLDLWIENAGEVTVPGTAAVILPVRS